MRWSQTWQRLCLYAHDNRIIRARYNSNYVVYPDWLINIPFSMLQPALNVWMWFLPATLKCQCHSFIQPNNLMFHSLCHTLPSSQHPWPMVYLTVVYVLWNINRDVFQKRLPHSNSYRMLVCSPESINKRWNIVKDRVNAAGPDSIIPKVLRTCACQLSVILSHNYSLK